MGQRYLKIHHLKTRLILLYTVVFFTVMAVFMGLTYMSIKQSIIRSVDESLTGQINLIKNMIETTTDASIKNYFRATAYSSLEVVSACYEKHKNGELTEAEAKELAWSLLGTQKMGPSGYVAIMSAQGKMLYHPRGSLIGEDLHEFSFIEKVLKEKEIFLEYQWKNPEDENLKDKAMYSIRFEPWDWYISVTGYRSEFMSLVTIEDFEDNVLAIRFGETGYPLVLDMEGTLLIHPQYKGVNMSNRNDSMGEITRKAIQEKNGRSEYYWKNPGESEYRKKLTLYSEIPQFGMIVAATAYETEFMKPLVELQRILTIIFAGALLLIVFLTLQISHSITQPIVDIKQKMDLAAAGDMGIRSQITTVDEIGEIGRHFNHFISTLQIKQEELGRQIQFNVEIADKLRSSLSELQETQQRLIEEERFSNMGRVLAKVSHHLNTPIGNAVTAASFIERETMELSRYNQAGDMDPHVVDEHISTIMESTGVLKKAVDRAIALIESFQKLQIHIKEGDREILEMSEFLENHYLNPWSNKLPVRIQQKVQCPYKLRIRTYPEVLELVLNNLTNNSINHSFRDGHSGTISVEVFPQDQGIELVYSDTGLGIPKEDADRVFEPFYSQDQYLKATGLGLNIVYNAIVGTLKGTIRYEGDTDNGVRYVIWLPSKA